MHIHKRILVTGGAGFIGSHLCERLIAQGAEVLCTDTDFRPLPRNDPRQRRPDSTKAEESLGWQAEAQLRDGLEKTIAYFDALLAGQPRDPVYVPASFGSR